MNTTIIITDEELEYFKDFQAEALIEDLMNVVESIESLGDFDENIFFE